MEGFVFAQVLYSGVFSLLRFCFCVSHCPLARLEVSDLGSLVWGISPVLLFWVGFASGLRRFVVVWLFTRYIAVDSLQKKKNCWPSLQENKFVCQVGMNELDGIDVYNFLHMVKTSSKQEETTSACLGNIDYLELEFDIAEWATSPERSSDKPIFEDIYEFQDDLENQMVDVGRPGALVAMSWWMIGGLPCLSIALFDEL